MSSAQMSLLPPFIPTRGSAQVLGGLFLFTAAISWIAVGYDFAEVRLVSALSAGAPVETAERLAHKLTGRWVGWFQIFCIGTTGIAFLVWLHRVRVNVRALGVRRLRYGREWTVLGFLIPVLNALRPYQVVTEIWKASDPSTGDPMAWKSLRASRLVWLWWMAFLAYIALEIFSATLLDFSVGLERIRFAHILGMTADVNAALSASLAYFVVAHISEAQDRKRATWGRGVAPSNAQPFDPRDAVA
ncbi:MAG TPA: DUF4328 domain-containing protein [Myxococcota bacterium]